MTSYDYSNPVLSVDGKAAGTAANDYLLGKNSSDDYMTGASGDDVLDGGAGNDRLYGGKGSDYIAGGAGNDKLFGDDGDDFVNGGVGNDLVNGGAGNDDLWGGAGSDEIRGGTGSDLLWGGAGSDVLAGGTGADRFLFKAADGISTSSANAELDRVLDLNFDEGDTVQFSGFEGLADFFSQQGISQVITSGDKLSSLVNYLRDADPDSVIEGRAGQDSVILKLAIAGTDDVQLIELYNYSQWLTADAALG